MRIHLVIPPSPFLINDRVFPFLGPLQIGALAKELGHEVFVSDLTGFRQRNNKKGTIEEVLEEAKIILLKDLQDNKSELVGFYSLAAQHPFVVELAKLVEVKKVIGGPHANTSPDLCTDDFDYVVVADQGGGGGEPGFIEMLKRLESGNAEKIIKVSSRIQGVKHQNDRFPLPDRSLIDLSSYHYYLDEERCTSIITAAGCAWACSFCSHWQGYRKLETKSPEKVKEEIRKIKKDYGWRGLQIYDDEVNLRKDFLGEFLPMLKDEEVIWRAFYKNGPKLTQEHFFKEMAESGCVYLCTGVESGDPEVLKNTRKGATLENNTDFVRYCTKYGIKSKCFLQVGLPGECPESIQKTRDWLVKMVSEGLTDADVSITTPYEGTPLMNEDLNIHFDREELDYSKNMILYKGVPGEYKSYVWHDNLTREDIVKARQWVEDEFRKARGLPPLVEKDDG